MHLKRAKRYQNTTIIEYLFPERLDEFLKSGNFPSELVFDIGVAVSESIDSRFEVQLQFVEILAIRFQFLLRFQTLVLFLKKLMSEGKIY